ncbi:MAG: GNAT family N-acetyltransferase [Anaerolineae bacterium]|nr:GNAT family N-acetyltransferase [Anaerolineae bacterium]
MSDRANQVPWPPAPEYSVRLAQSTDIDRLVELLLALQGHIEGSNPTLWQMTAEARANLRGQVVSRLSAENGCAVVAAHSQAGLVGMAFGRVVTNHRYRPSRAGLIDQLYVDPGHRRRGIGQRLVSELCGFFARQGVDDLSLRYVVGNAEAAAFWTALGFEPRIVTAGASRRQVEAILVPDG